MLPCLQKLNHCGVCKFFVCFVCLGFFVPLDNFSLIWRCHHCLWRAANFDLCSALMAFEQWEFLSVPHLLWHGASVYNGQFRGPLTLTPNAERLAVELCLPVFATWVCGGWDSNIKPSAGGSNALTHCATAAAISIERYNKLGSCSNSTQSQPNIKTFSSWFKIITTPFMSTGTGNCSNTCAFINWNACIKQSLSRSAL